MSDNDKDYGHFLRLVELGSKNLRAEEIGWLVDHINDADRRLWSDKTERERLARRMWLMARAVAGMALEEGLDKAERIGEAFRDAVKGRSN